MLISEIIEKLNQIKQTKGDINISYLYQYHYDMYGKVLFGRNDDSKINIYDTIQVGEHLECYRNNPEINNVHQYYLSFKVPQFGQ